MDPSGTNAAVDADQKMDPDSGQLPPLSPQDKQTVLQLYQTCPQLWAKFRHMLELCDMADQRPVDYSRLRKAIYAVVGISKHSQTDQLRMAQFAAAVGFAEQAVKMISLSKATGEIGLRCVSILEDADQERMCASGLLYLLVYFTNSEHEIHHRLAKTGFFDDTAKCLEFLQHLPAELLKESTVIHNLLGILLNCCKSPSVALLVRQMDIAPLIAAFVSQTATGNIRIVAMAVLAFIVRDDQLTLLELDAAMLTNYLTQAQLALVAPEHINTMWAVEEIVVTLSLVARYGFNRRFIVAKEGVVDVLMRTLRSKIETEQEAAAAALEELAKDPVNAQIFKRHKELVQLLSSVQDSKREAVRQAVSNTLTVIGQADPDIGDLEENTSLYDVLAEQSNALTILGVGKVEFVLSQLTQLTSGGSSSHGDVTRVKVLQALQELATDSSCSREIFSRGGLQVLHTLIRSSDTDTNTDTDTARDIDSGTPNDTATASPSDSDSDSVRLESTRLLLQLTSSKEHCLLIQAHPQLTQRLTTLTQRDNAPLAQACAGLLEAIPAQTVSIVKNRLLTSFKSQQTNRT